MQILEYIILGIIQGITEFLPISSSGHILIGRHFFNINQPGINIEVFLHSGTLLSIIVFWYKDILYEIKDFRYGKSNFFAAIIIGTFPAAIIGLTKSLAKELASRNITVNAINPGYIATNMTKAMSEEQRSDFLNLIPLKAFGKPTDVAFLAAFLASDLSNYITGETINIDGGIAI